MNHMKTLTFKISLLLFALISMTTLKAQESITSPNGELKLNFFLSNDGEPEYELFYKNKEVIKPSKLGLELKNDPGLMKGFTIDRKSDVSGKSVFVFVYSGFICM